MSGIKYVLTTDLFWKTLSDYRRHANYQMIRDKIDETIFKKISDRHHRTSRDKPFDSDGNLHGIWHTRLSQEFDVVLFYTVKGDDLTLAMMGNHGDYPNGGKNKAKSGPLADRIWRAVDGGHNRSPKWDSLRWAHPSDLVGHPDLHEMDPRAIDFVRQDLRDEAASFTKFKRLTGLDPESKEGLPRACEYLDAIDVADAALTAASIKAKLSFDKHLDKAPAHLFGMLTA